jgi:phage/plasmid-associated DNA primase
MTECEKKCDYNNEYFKEYFFLEKINAQKLYAIINCDDAVLHVKKWWEDHNFTTQYGDTISNEKDHLQNILDSLKKNKETGDFELSVQYFSRGEYGRVYAKNAMSLGMLRRPIRHYICDGVYYDIDMINAHPTIAVGLCKKWNIECEHLQEYVKKRGAKLKEYMKLFDITRGDVKTMFCSMLNGGSWRTTIKTLKGTKYKIEECKSTEYLDFVMVECLHICMEFRKKVPNSMYDEITQKKSLKRAKNRTFIAVFLQIYEEKILRCLYGMFEEYNLINTGYAKCILCHDGAMIQKSIFDTADVNIDDFIRELNDLVEEEIGFRCDYKLKEFDEKDTTRDILDNHIKKRKEEGKDFIDPNNEYVDPWVEKYGIWKGDIIESTDTALANLFYLTNKSSFVGCHRKLYKKNAYGLYQETTSQGLRQSYKEHMNDFVAFKGKKASKWDEFADVLKRKFYVNDAVKDDEKTKKYIQVKNCQIIRQQVNEITDMFKINKSQILSKLRNNKGEKDITATLISMYDDDDFAEKLDTDHKLLGFNNGVIDLEGESIFEVRNAKDGEYVSMSCGYDFYIDEKVKKDSELIYNLINEMFEDETVTEFVIMSIAKCVAGGNNTEEFATFWLGEGGNGKGLLTTLIENVFGDYFCPLSYKIFTHIKEDNRSVELFEGRKKRYFSVSEPAKKFTMNSDTFKLWTGKDPVSVRNNYATKMTKYTPSTTNFQSNHHIQFDGDTSGVSMIRRIVAILFPNLFKKEEDFDENNSKHKKRDSTWKDKCCEDRYKRAFMCLLLTYYAKYRVRGLSIPEKVKEYSKEYTKHITPDRDWFDNKLVKDEENGNNLAVKLLLDEFREDTKSHWRMKKFCEKLEELGYKLANGRAYSLGGKYQSGGNSTKYVKNVRFTGFESESDDEDNLEEKIIADIALKKEKKPENTKIKMPEPKKDNIPEMFKKKEVIEDEGAKEESEFYFWEKKNPSLVKKLRKMWEHNDKYVGPYSDAWTLQHQYFENKKNGVTMEYI